MAEYNPTPEECRAAIITWATVFEKKEWSTGPGEIVSTLLNISDHKEGMNETAERILMEALKGSAFIHDKEIMAGVKSARKHGELDETEWWWWPEKL